MFTAGLGTLLFQFVTKGQVPIFLASSFAFIAPIIASVQMWGIPATMGGPNREELMTEATRLRYEAIKPLLKRVGKTITYGWFDGQ